MNSINFLNIISGNKEAMQSIGTGKVVEGYVKMKYYCNCYLTRQNIILFTIYCSSKCILQHEFVCYLIMMMDEKAFLLIFHQYNICLLIDTKGNINFGNKFVSDGNYLLNTFIIKWFINIIIYHYQIILLPIVYKSIYNKNFKS